MISLRGLIRTNRRYRAAGLGGLLLDDGFFRLPPTIGTLLLRLVMGMRFLVVLATLPAEKEQNLLSVATCHAASFRIWRVVVKRRMMAVA